MIELNIQGPVFISTGEPSGDLYGSFLARDIMTTDPGLRLFAVGGKNMADMGVDVLLDYKNLTAFGFSSGILSAYRNHIVYKKIARLMYAIQPKTFISIAYPGLNLLLCKYAKTLGCKVYYYIPPQIWAWGTFRKYFIKKWVDRVISIIPFEYEFYRNSNINVGYFQNPLFLELRGYKRNIFKKSIGFMPGSRNSEIKRNLPVAVGLMKKIWKKKNNIEFQLILQNDSLGIVKKIIARNEVVQQSLKANEDILSIKLISENRYQAMKNCDLLVVCSGTASLEAAAMSIPQIFFNRPAFADYYIFKRFIKIREYNLTNLYFNDHIVQSFVSTNMTNLISNLYSSLCNNILIDE